MPVAGGRQLGAREEEPRDDQSQDEVALPRGPGSDEGIEAEPPDHDQNRFNVPVGECMDVLEDLGGGYEGFPFERATNQVDDGEWEV